MKKNDLKLVIMMVLFTFSLCLAILTIFSDIHYEKALNEINMREDGTDSTIIEVMEKYGYDMQGDPNKELTQLDLWKAYLKNK